MLALDYNRWGFLKSRLVYFADHSPPTNGYHFVICRHCYAELPDFPAFKKFTKPTLVIDLDQDIDAIFNQIHLKRRKLIRRGLKMNFEIKTLELTLENLKLFQKYFNKTIVKRGATPILNLNYFKSILPFSTIMQASHEGNILDILILLHDSQTVRAHYIAHSDFKFDHKNRYYINSVLYWEVIKYFHRLGYRRFDFGGLEPHHLSPPQGYTAFKLTFGGRIVQTYNYEAALTPAAKLFMKLMQQTEYAIRRIAHRKIRQ